MQLGRKIGFSLLLKNESNQLSKTSCTSRKTKLHQKRLKFTCKCEACSKCISQTNIEVLVHKRWLQKPLQHHAKSRKRPKTYQSQMLFHHSAPHPELCTKKTLLSPNSSCHTKSCRNVAHVHRINGSLYFHTLTSKHMQIFVPRYVPSLLRNKEHTMWPPWPHLHVILHFFSR